MNNIKEGCYRCLCVNNTKCDSGLSCFDGVCLSRKLVDDFYEFRDGCNRAKQENILLKNSLYVTLALLLLLMIIILVIFAIKKHKNFKNKS